MYWSRAVLSNPENMIMISNGLAASNVLRGEQQCPSFSQIQYRQG
jgi:hypothetical protein